MFGSQVSLGVPTIGFRAYRVQAYGVYIGFGVYDAKAYPKP